MIFLNAPHRQRHLLCCPLRGPTKALVLNCPRLPPLHFPPVPTGGGREGQLVCHAGLDVIVWGEPTKTWGDGFKSSHQNYAGDSFSLLVQFSKHFQLMPFDPQIWPSQLGYREWVGDGLWCGSACQLRGQRWGSLGAATLGCWLLVVGSCPHPSMCHTRAIAGSLSRDHNGWEATGRAGAFISLLPMRKLRSRDVMCHS